MVIFKPKLFFYFLQNGYGDSYERGGNPRTGYYCFAINTNTTIILLLLNQREKNVSEIIIKRRKNNRKYFAIQLQMKDKYMYYMAKK